MKIAVIAFDGDKAIGGSFSSAKRIKNMLNYSGINAEIDTVSISTSGVHTCDLFDVSLNMHDAADELRNYDFLYIVCIETIANQANAKLVMEKLSEIPKSMICHDEWDLRSPDLPRYFMSLPNMKFVQYIEPYSLDERHSQVQDPTVLGIKEFVVPCQIDLVDDKFTDPDILPNKTNALIHCGRIANRKKISYLTKMSPYLHRDVELWGQRNAGIHNVNLEAIPEFSKIYKGTYDTPPSTKSWYSWSVVMVGKGYKLEFHPRIERSTIESLMNYSLPVLLEESVPPELQDYPIMLNWLGDKSLARISTPPEVKASYVDELLDPWDSTPIEVKAGLCRSLFDKIVCTTRYREIYEDISKFIMSI